MTRNGPSDRLSRFQGSWDTTQPLLMASRRTERLKRRARTWVVRVLAALGGLFVFLVILGLWVAPDEPQPVVATPTFQPPPTGPAAATTGATAGQRAQPAPPVEVEPVAEPEPAPVTRAKPESTPTTTRAKPQPTPVAKPRPTAKPTSSTHYASCAEARAAGAAPLQRGEPGYRAGLDRDGDGTACER